MIMLNESHIKFKHDNPFTIGIEEEYMICEPTSGDLVNKAEEIMAERIDCIIKHDQLEELPKIKNPILVLVGREDFVTPVYYSEKIASLIPNSELKIFDKGGHFIYLTYPNEFNNTVLNFINRNEIF